MPADQPVPTISKLNRAIAFTVFSLMALGMLWGLGTGLLLPALRTGVPPPTFSWTSIILISLFVVATFSWFSIVFYMRFATEISADGVSAPTLRGRRELRWSQIVRVEGRGYEIHLFGESISIVVNTACYSRPEKVVQFLADRVRTI